MAQGRRIAEGYYHAQMGEEEAEGEEEREEGEQEEGEEGEEGEGEDRKNSIKDSHTSKCFREAAAPALKAEERVMSSK